MCFPQTILMMITVKGPWCRLSSFVVWPLSLATSSHMCHCMVKLRWWHALYGHLWRIWSLGCDFQQVTGWCPESLECWWVLLDVSLRPTLASFSSQSSWPLFSWLWVFLEEQYQARYWHSRECWFAGNELVHLLGVRSFFLLGFCVLPILFSSCSSRSSCLFPHVSSIQVGSLFPVSIRPDFDLTFGLLSSAKCLCDLCVSLRTALELNFRSWAFIKDCKGPMQAAKFEMVWNGLSQLMQDIPISILPSLLSSVPWWAIWTLMRWKSKLDASLLGALFQNLQGAFGLTILMVVVI